MENSELYEYNTVNTLNQLYFLVNVQLTVQIIANRSDCFRCIIILIFSLLVLLRKYSKFIIHFSQSCTKYFIGKIIM